MNQFLLIVHFFGLGIAATGLVGAYIVQLVINSNPSEQAAVFVRAFPRFTRAGQIGLGLLLITGPLLLWLKWNGSPPHGGMFIAKMIGVLLLIVMAVLLAINGRRAMRHQDTIAASRLPLYRRIAITILMLVVTFAVLAFR